MPGWNIRHHLLFLIFHNHPDNYRDRIAYEEK
jgi:hypothetical protein